MKIKTTSQPAPARRLVFVTTNVFLGSFLLIGITIAPLCAQSYPNKPIRLIVPYAPGGPVDIQGRTIGPKLTERLGQSVIVDNRGGANGNIGTELVAKAPADGYTLLVTNISHAINVSLYKKLGYDPINDFSPISLLAQSRLVLFVRSSLPVNGLKELVEHARANPGKLSFGSGGIGTPSHLTGELLNSLAKINIVHVSYKGGGPAMVALMSGEVDMQGLAPGAAVPGIQTGKVRPLAVLSNERLPSLPNVPTAKEAGLDNYEVNAWYGILAPAGTPREIVNRLAAEWTKIAAMPDTKEKMQKIDFEPVAVTPEAFSGFLKMEIGRWAKLLKNANINLD